MNGSAADTGEHRELEEAGGVCCRVSSPGSHPVQRPFISSTSLHLPKKCPGGLSVKNHHPLHMALQPLSRLGSSRLQHISPLASSPTHGQHTCVSAASSAVIFLMLCLKMCMSVPYLRCDTKTLGKFLGKWNGETDTKKLNKA